MSSKRTAQFYVSRFMDKLVYCETATECRSGVTFPLKIHASSPSWDSTAQSGSSDISYISAERDHLQGSFPFCFCRRLSVASLLMLHIDLKRHRRVSAGLGLQVKGVLGNTVHSVVEAAGLTGLKSCGSLPPANVGSSLNHTSKLPLLWSGMKNKGRDLKFVTITRGNRNPTVFVA